MTEEAKKVSEAIFLAIVSEVVAGESAPYQYLIKKVNDIDVDYFENITRDEETLSPELNMELKSRVVEKFKEETARLYAPDREAALLADARRRIKEWQQAHPDSQAECEALNDVKSRLNKYAADRLLFIPAPEWDEETLNEMYEQAREITLLEHIFNNNKEDIIAFHHALQSRTAWECRTWVEEQTSTFLKGIASKL